MARSKKNYKFVILTVFRYTSGFTELGRFGFYQARVCWFLPSCDVSVFAMPGRLKPIRPTFPLRWKLPSRDVVFTDLRISLGNYQAAAKKKKHSSAP
jgi:hypothetical protein